MFNNLWKALILTASIGAIGAIAATAGEPNRAFARKCAERDLQVVTAIEDRGRAGDVAAETLGQAGLARIRAQETCLQGRVGAALATYDRILASLDPVRFGAVLPRFRDQERRAN